jgi:hypothetical protein
LWAEAARQASGLVAGESSPGAGKIRWVRAQGMVAESQGLTRMVFQRNLSLIIKCRRGFLMLAIALATLPISGLVVFGVLARLAKN